MVNEELRVYVFKQRSQGMSDEEIRTVLMDHGWFVEDVDDALGLNPVRKEAVNHTIDTRKRESGIRWWQVVLIIMVGVIVLGVVTVGDLVYYGINPTRQFASARDSQRRSDLHAITNALSQYSVENSGNLPVGMPVGEANAVTIGTGGGNLDLSEYLVPTYLAEIPYDPLTGNLEDTDYTIFETERGRVVASASSELTSGWVSVER